MSFKALFRASKFAALQPNQVITTSGALRQKGDWGIKHSLPRDLTSKYIHVEAQDQEYGAKFKCAKHKVTLMERYLENFPPLKMPHPLPVESTNKDLCKASKEEWIEIVRKAEAERSKWIEHQKQNGLAESQWSSFLGVDKPGDSADRNVHLPTYRIEHGAKPIKTQARILNATGYSKGTGSARESVPQALGLGGFVVEVSNRTASQITGGIGCRSAKPPMVTVESVRGDANGKIIATVDIAENSNYRRKEFYRTQEPAFHTPLDFFQSPEKPTNGNQVNKNPRK